MDLKNFSILFLNYGLVMQNDVIAKVFLKTIP